MLRKLCRGFFPIIHKPFKILEKMRQLHSVLLLTPARLKQVWLWMILVEACKMGQNSRLS